MVKFVGFNRTPALFVGFRCQGLAALFSCLIATVDLLLFTAVKVFTGFVHVLKALEFLESNFKALKVLEIGFWSLKVLDFLLNKIETYQHL